ncbi:MAG: 30S ribosomal protein S12 methylthiotransferase RimO [Bacteroidota bacterium]|nr:30S ribosomal protein S12 methylthiotransferase RimO [Bacteroidota bacterium]
MNTPTHKIHIITLGCAKNTVDSEALHSQLRGNDFELTENMNNASVAIINTCGFIEEAKKQSIETILEAVKRKNEGKLQHVYVMGCLSERYHADLQREIPEVSGFFGSNDQPKIVSALGGNYKYELLGERALSTPRHYAYVKISEGCDNPCSFCAIPLMRGTHRSKPIEQIMSEVMKLVAKGVKELIVIGQDTTYYGLDLYGSRKLASLLRSLATVKELEWIRLMYAYPAKFPLDVLDVFAENPKICPYIDIPVQHASDEVLKSMRRGITRRAVTELIGKIRSAVPHIALRTTLIAGYPNETESDVNELIEFMREIEFDRLGVFTYSQEDDTAAYALGDPIPQEEKENRRARLMEVQRQISIRRNEEKIGSVVRAVVERKEDGVFAGRTVWDAPEIDDEIFIAGSERHPQESGRSRSGASAPEREMFNLSAGTFVDVLVTDATEHDLYGKAVHQS